MMFSFFKMPDRPSFGMHNSQFWNLSVTVINVIHFVMPREEKREREKQNESKKPAEKQCALFSHMDRQNASSDACQVYTRHKNGRKIETDREERRFGFLKKEKPQLFVKHILR